MGAPSGAPQFRATIPHRFVHSIGGHMTDTQTVSSGKGCLYIFLFEMALPIITMLIVTMGVYIIIPLNIYLEYLPIWYGFASTVVGLLLAFRYYRQNNSLYFPLAAISIIGFTPVLAFISLSKENGC